MSRVTTNQLNILNITPIQLDALNRPLHRRWRLAHGVLRTSYCDTPDRHLALGELLPQSLRNTVNAKACRLILRSSSTPTTE